MVSGLEFLHQEVDQLLFKTFLLDSEIDHGDSGRHIWLVGRVTKLGGHVELEVFVIGDICTTDVDLPVSTGFFDLFGNNRVQSWVK
jgi:hypothetical protein